MTGAGVSKLKVAGEAETGVDDKQRFLLELEFIQCLSNPHYLNWLAQNRYLDDPAFVKFLEYLQYWTRPEYATFIVYPSSLHFLNLLLKPEFRAAIANPNYKELVHSQQFFTWQHYKHNRLVEKLKQ